MALALLSTLGFPLFLWIGDRERIVSIVSDDAYYYFSVAANIAQGHGPTADGITKTTGFHPLYGFLLAGLYRLTSPTPDGLVRLAIALNAICFLATGCFLALAARQLWGRLAAILAFLLWLTNPHASLVSAIGLEGSVYGLTLSLLFWRLTSFADYRLHAGSGGEWLLRSAILGVYMGMTLLARTDSLVLVPMIALVLWWIVPNAALVLRVSGVVLFTAISLGLLSLWWRYAWIHTGEFLQGSAAIKTLWRPAIVEEEYGKYTLVTSVLFGGSVWLPYLVKCFFKIPALKWSLSALPQLFSSAEAMTPRRLTYHICWIFPALLGIAYAMMIDRPRTWYYVPALVTLTLLTAGAAGLIMSSPPTNLWLALARRFLPWLGWLIVIESAAIGGRNLLYGRSSEQVGGLRAAQWVTENVEKGIVIGCWHSGIVQFYTPNHTVINLDGLANNEILSVLGGDKTMNEYWDERGITLILGEPRQKMGGYARAWNGKKLEPVRNGVQRVGRNPHSTETLPAP